MNKSVKWILILFLTACRLNITEVPTYDKETTSLLIQTRQQDVESKTETQQQNKVLIVIRINGPGGVTYQEGNYSHPCIHEECIITTHTPLTATLTPTPIPGSVFIDWANCKNIKNSTKNCVIKLPKGSDNQIITALFRLLPPKQPKPQNKLPSIIKLA